jgi:hypothetical protein
MELGVIRDFKFDIGKCAVFEAPYWDATTNLFATGGPLTFLAPTTGPVQFAANPDYSNLTVQEYFGPGILKRYINGTSPSATVRMFPTLELMKRISPTGLASMGFERQRLVKPSTLFILPERLLQEADANGFMQKVPVVLDAGVWKKNGVAIAAGSEDERLLHEGSIVVWKADFTPLTLNYAWEEGGRSDVDVEITAQIDLDKPEGCNQILVLGEAFNDYPDFDTAVLDFEPV